MADLRIFSYLPNPRLFKSTIAARLTGVEIEIRGDRPKMLAQWLWDFDARPATDEDKKNPAYIRKARAGFAGELYKTDEFLNANPLGTVPVAFSPDGTTGIFESNSMMRAVARLAKHGPALYGSDPYVAARIDGFLDTSLNFANTSQRYLFGLMGKGLTDAMNDEMAKACTTYFGCVEGALNSSAGFIVGDHITLADICYAAEVSLFALSRTESGRIEDAGFDVLFSEQLAEEFPRAWSHFHDLLEDPAFMPDLTPYYREMTLEKFLS